MPSVLVPQSTHVRVAVAVVLCVLAPQVAAQAPSIATTADDGVSAKDPGMVIARTVNPRIAYRGIPTEENPIHSEATLFPARTFHAAIEGITGQLLGDDALGARGSAGVHAGAATDAAMRRVFAGEASPLGPGLGARAAGMGASGVVGGPGAMGGTAVGGAVGRAVGGSGGMTGGLLGALPAIMPTQQGGGP
ncbi:MAG: hypothetical protein ACREPV_00255 [Lysobacter sp.]